MPPEGKETAWESLGKGTDAEGRDLLLGSDERPETNKMG